MTYEEARKILECDAINIVGELATGKNARLELTLDAIDTAIEALEKQIPREHEIRVNRCHKKEIYCPNCDRYHGLYGAPSMDAYSKFCPWCGQALDMRYATK